MRVDLTDREVGALSDTESNRTVPAVRQSLPLSERNCRCGRLLDVFGHHRAACARVGMLGRRGFAVESTAAMICREAGGRVRTNVVVRDMDLPEPGVADARRLEVVVDGLPLRRGAQPAVDTTLVCALYADGTPRRNAALEDGAVLKAAKRKKVRAQTGQPQQQSTVGSSGGRSGRPTAQ